MSASFEAFRGKDECGVEKDSSKNDELRPMIV